MPTWCVMLLGAVYVAVIAGLLFAGVYLTTQEDWGATYEAIYGLLR